MGRDDTQQPTDQLQDGHLHHTLIEIGWLVFHHLNGHYFMGLHVLAFHHLTERALAENVQYQVSVELKHGSSFHVEPENDILVAIFSA